MTEFVKKAIVSGYTEWLIFRFRVFYYTHVGRYLSWCLSGKVNKGDVIDIAVDEFNRTVLTGPPCKLVQWASDYDVGERPELFHYK